MNGCPLPHSLVPRFLCPYRNNQPGAPHSPLQKRHWEHPALPHTSSSPGAFSHHNPPFPSATAILELLHFIPHLLPESCKLHKSSCKTSELFPLFSHIFPAIESQTKTLLRPHSLTHCLPLVPVRVTVISALLRASSTAAPCLQEASCCSTPEIEVKEKMAVLRIN